VAASKVREAVLGLRGGKGMVLDAEDHDTWSAGSFFTNPLLSPEQAAVLPEDAPRWEQPDGRVKSSAAWLIERSGFSKGYGNDRVSLSTKHTLALTNRGGASTADLVALAREIRTGVEDQFGVRLENEPVMVGCSL
jgi:UDP-N-acetylmuramate dehydrogenase